MKRIKTHFISLEIFIRVSKITMNTLIIANLKKFRIRNKLNVSSLQLDWHIKQKAVILRRYRECQPFLKEEKNRKNPASYFTITDTIFPIPSRHYCWAFQMADPGSLLPIRQSKVPKVTLLFYQDHFLRIRKTVCGYSVKINSARNSAAVKISGMIAGRLLLIYNRFDFFSGNIKYG